MLCHDDEPGLIDLGDAIEWGHPDNAGLALWLLGVEGAIGSRWHDLTGKTAGGTTAGGTTAWSATPFGTVAPSLRGGKYVTFPRPATATIAASYWLHAPDDVGATPRTGIFATINDSSSWYQWAPLDTRLEWKLAGTTIDLLATHSMAVGGQYRLTWLYDGGTAAVYQNGVRLGSATGSGTPTFGAGPAGFSFSGYVPSSSVGGIRAGSCPVVGLTAMDGYARRDYDWSIAESRDSRLRRYRATTYFTPPVAAAISLYLPAFAGPALGW